MPPAPVEREKPCVPFPSGPISWRLRIDGPLSGEENMRIDAGALDDQKDPDALPLFRLYQWDRPTVSFGRLQDPEMARRLAGPRALVRRPTGGGTVFHDTDLSLSLVWRRDHAGFPKCLSDIYRAVHETVEYALKKEGIETNLHAGHDGRGTPAGICFNEPVRDDLIWKGRKVLGGALKVSGWGRLYQGNLLVGTLGVKTERLIPRLVDFFSARFFLSPPRQAAVPTAAALPAG